MKYLCNWMPRLALLAIPFSGLLPTMDALLFGLGLVLIPIIIVSSTIAAWRGHEPTRRSYWFVLVLLLGVTPYVLMQVGYFPYDTMLVYLAQSSTLLALLMLSFEQMQQTRRIREAKERMEAISKTKDEFLTTMSHELRTPMNAIVGINTLLNMTSLNTEQQDCVHKLEISSAHLLRLIDEVLDLSRMQQVEIMLNRTPFALNRLLDELRQMFGILAENKRLRLHIQPVPHQPPPLLGDSVRLLQILTNLLSNAIKYTERGEVRLTTQLDQQDDRSVTLHFAVTDTGIGIVPEHLPRLFEPFYQISPQHRTNSSGLGLAIPSAIENSVFIF
jgi:signal transduction histidine kinase